MMKYNNPARAINPYFIIASMKVINNNFQINLLLSPSEKMALHFHPESKGLDGT